MAILGKHACPSSLRQACLAFADDSFTRVYPFALEDLPPAPAGWKYELSTAIVVRLKGFCDPHTDPYLGLDETEEGENTEHRSVFWLLKDTSKRASWLMADQESHRMAVDDWAFFDSSQLHAFLADGTWVGISIQLSRD